MIIKQVKTILHNDCVIELNPEVDDYQRRLKQSKAPFIIVADCDTHIIGINWGLDENLDYNELEVIIFGKDSLTVDDWVEIQLQRRNLLRLKNV